jgi:hypothetical protein
MKVKVLEDRVEEYKKEVGEVISVQKEERKKLSESL